MEFLKNKFKSKKVEALFKDITPIEYLLICIPFLISIISIPSTISNLYGGKTSNYQFLFVFVALVFIIVLSFFFLIGLRQRIIYFVIMLAFGISLNIFLGTPWAYNYTAGRDSAIRVGIEAILRGEFPYYSRTSLGNRPSPLPFTFIFYLPIYLITGGHTAYMNIIIISIFCIVLIYNFVDTERDYLILPIMAFIIFSDWFFLEAATNSDVINSILIFCMILFLIPDEISEQKNYLRFLLIPEKPKKIDKKIIIFAILFGCLLAMRIYFWLVGIIVALYIFKIYGLKNTIYLGLLSISVSLAWILPFMLQDINYFLNVSPLGTNSGKFSRWRSYSSIHPIGHFFLAFLNTFLNFGSLNAIIIVCIIFLISFLLGLIKCENKFHLLLIIAFCYFVFLFFYLFGYYYTLIGDYLSIAAVPFIFSFLYIDIETKKKREE